MADDGEIHIGHARRFLDQPIVESLMIPLDVVMLRVFLHSMGEPFIGLSLGQRGPENWAETVDLTLA